LTINTKIISPFVNYSALCAAARVTRRMGKKFAQNLEVVTQTVAKAKNDKIS
jgi:hypothetical protein